MLCEITVYLIFGHANLVENTYNTYIPLAIKVVKCTPVSTRYKTVLFLVQLIQLGIN